MELDHIDLFCGGGGSSRGFHQLGFKSLVAIDQENFCVNTYKANFGKVAYQRDISKLRSEPILEFAGKKPLVVTASPPCEPFTVANQNRIKDPLMRLFDDPIGRLMLHAIRLIGDIEPEFYMIENVTGILDGEGRDLISEEFNRVGMGDPYFTYIDAVKWGVPSNRVRVIITNFRLKNLNEERKTVADVINSLPPPNYPHEFVDHVVYELNPKHKKKIIYLSAGEGLVYFRGAKKDFKNYVRLDFDRPAPVVMGKSRFIHPVDDRVLSPRENARLMTFPDNHIFLGNIEQIYDMIGEAVPPKITTEIARQIVEQV